MLFVHPDFPFDLVDLFSGTPCGMSCWYQCPCRGLKDFLVVKLILNLHNMSADDLLTLLSPSPL